MANDFGLKVGVDGEAQFKKALAEINTSLKTLGTEAKLVASQYDKNDKSTEALTAKTGVLTKQIETQKSKVETLKNALEASNAKYGEGSKQSQKYQQQLNLAEAELNNLTKAEKDAGKQIEDTADKTEKGGSKISKAAKAIGTGLAAIGTAAAAATTALVKFTTDTASTADDLLTESQVTGIATDKLQELAYSADLVDTSVETITGAMTKNIKSMTAAQKGTEETVQAYEALGVSWQDANGEMRDGEEVFWELIDALGQVDNETQRDAYAMTLLGKSAQDLNPLIEAGSARMAELAEEAHETGYVMDGETLSAFGALQDQIDTLTNRGQTLALNLGEILLPILTDLGDTANDALASIGTALKAGDLDGVIEVVNDLVPALIEEIANIAGKVVKALLQNLPTILQTVLDIVYQILNYLTANASEIVSSLVVIVNEVVTLLLNNLPTLITTVLDLVVAVLTAVTDNLPMIIDTISQITPAVVDALIGALPQILEGLWELTKAIIKNLPQILLSIAKSLWSEIEAIFTALFLGLNDWFEEHGKDIMTGLWNGIKSVFAKIGEWFSNAFGKVKGAISKLFGKDTADELTNAFNSADLETSVSANVSATASGTTSQSEAMEEQNSLLRAILEKDTGVYIGDEALATSVNRYNSTAGIAYVGGGY